MQNPTDIDDFIGNCWSIIKRKWRVEISQQEKTVEKFTGDDMFPSIYVYAC